MNLHEKFLLVILLRKKIEAEFLKLFNIWRMAYHSLFVSCKLCYVALVVLSWLQEMLLKKLFHMLWDFVTSPVKTINSTFFNNKEKISTASVKKDNVASFKKQKKEAIALWYSLIIILYLHSCMLHYLPLDQFWFSEVFVTLS